MSNCTSACSIKVRVLKCVQIFLGANRITDTALEFFPKQIYCWGSILEQKELATHWPRP